MRSAIQDFENTQRPLSAPLLNPAIGMKPCFRLESEISPSAGEAAMQIA